MRFIDTMARIYESPLWYPVVLKLFGGMGSPTLAQLIETVSADVAPVAGRVLDVACGPATFGRRVASVTRDVFGIDVSMGMLRQGARYTAKEHVSNVRFARARVEALPFQSGSFDAVLCCGSLHLFSDTEVALREMARVMKPAAVLSVFTFGAGGGGLSGRHAFARGTAAGTGCTCSNSVSSKRTSSRAALPPSGPASPAPS